MIKVNSYKEGFCEHCGSYGDESYDVCGGDYFFIIGCTSYCDSCVEANGENTKNAIEKFNKENEIKPKFQ